MINVTPEQRHRVLRHLLVRVKNGIMDDILIVGGGVIGLSIAYELSGHGMRIRLVDRALPGREASWAGAGILPPANQATARHAIDALRGLSHRLHPVWAERLQQQTGIDTGYRRCGGIYLARSPGEAVSLHAAANLFRDDGLEIEPLSPDDIRSLEPELADLVDRGALKAAYLMPEEAQLRNPHHLQALELACRQAGVELEAGVEVTGFNVEKSTCLSVNTRNGLRRAERICLTSGAWTCLLLKELGIPTGILPVRGQMVLFQCQTVPFRHILNEGPRYLVPRDDGRVLVGSTEEEEGFDKSTTASAIADLTALAQDLVPALRDARRERSWAGLRPGSFDGFPYIGKLPGLDNAFVAAGHFRSGLHLSPGTAVVVSQLLRGEQPEIDLTPFRVGRG